MTPALNGENASFSYKGIVAVEDASFLIEKGTFVTICGPNGSGKSTLLKMMAGISRTRSGRILLSGLDLSVASKRRIARISAWVPQSPEPVYGFRVKDLVMMGRAPHQGFLGLISARDRAASYEAMEKTDTIRLKDRFITDLSGGELQRVYVARALCQTSELLLLDEPTSSLDPAHQIQIMEVLKKLVSDCGSTVVMISHDLNLCSMYADSIILMKESRIKAIGKPGSVLNPSLLENVYQCQISVRHNPDLGFATVIPMPKKNLGSL